MAGGGHVIIRGKLRAAAETNVVKDNVPFNKVSKLELILAKADGDWTDDETHFVRHCIGVAYDALT